MASWFEKMNAFLKTDSFLQQWRGRAKESLPAHIRAERAEAAQNSAEHAVAAIADPNAAAAQGGAVSSCSSEGTAEGTAPPEDAKASSVELPNGFGDGSPTATATTAIGPRRPNQTDAGRAGNGRAGKPKRQMAKSRRPEKVANRAAAASAKTMGHAMGSSAQKESRRGINSGPSGARQDGPISNGRNRRTEWASPIRPQLVSSQLVWTWVDLIDVRIVSRGVTRRAYATYVLEVTPTIRRSLVRPYRVERRFRDFEAFHNSISATIREAQAMTAAATIKQKAQAVARRRQEAELAAAAQEEQQSMGGGGQRQRSGHGPRQQPTRSLRGFDESSGKRMPSMESMDHGGLAQLLAAQRHLLGSLVLPVKRMGWSASPEIIVERRDLLSAYLHHLVPLQHSTLPLSHDPAAPDCAEVRHATPHGTQQGTRHRGPATGDSPQT
eukprot:SAG11_NODE_1552_length_4697_cov_2.785124_1_plen_440_part_00